MHPSSKNLIFHIANEVCKQSPDTPKQAETNRTNRAEYPLKHQKNWD